MEKSATTSHKSHMSCIGRLTARSPQETGGWQSIPPGRDAEAPGAEAGDDGGSDTPGSPGDYRLSTMAMATRWAFMAECRVDESAWPQSRVRRPGRITPETPETPDTASTAAMATMPATATPQASAARRPADAGLRRAAARRAHRAEPAAGNSGPARTRGGGISHPARGARRGAWQAASAANRRQLGKGQGAYFPADGTEVQGAARVLRLSRRESLIYAQDLQSATLSD
jgi:hypothetical protein